jgi:hypothetical protein
MAALPSRGLHLHRGLLVREPCHLADDGEELFVGVVAGGEVAEEHLEGLGLDHRLHAPTAVLREGGMGRGGAGREETNTHPMGTVEEEIFDLSESLPLRLHAVGHVRVGLDVEVVEEGLEGDVSGPCAVHHHEGLADDVFPPRRDLPLRREEDMRATERR